MKHHLCDESTIHEPLAGKRNSGLKLVIKKSWTLIFLSSLQIKKDSHLLGLFLVLSS